MKIFNQNYCVSLKIYYLRFILLDNKIHYSYINCYNVILLYSIRNYLMA